MNECTFEELPELISGKITRLGSALGNRGSIEILRCIIDGENHAECIIKDGSLIGLYRQQWDDVTYTWLNSSDIDFLHNAIQSTRP